LAERGVRISELESELKKESNNKSQMIKGILKNSGKTSAQDKFVRDFFNSDF
jgi:hypothetical protein